MKRQFHGPVEFVWISLILYLSITSRLLTVLIAMVTLMLAGCAKVEPGADFAAVHESITDRTGADVIFDPNEEHLTAGRIDQLLSDGLTVDECVQLALLNNPDFQGLFDQIGASRADLVQSQLLTNPNLSVSILWPEGGGRHKIPMNLGQELSDLWQIPIRKRIAEAQLEQVMLSAAHRGVDLAAETRAAAYRLLAAQEAYTLAEENTRFVERFEEIARQRASLPGASPADTTRVRAVLLEARLARLTLQRDSRQARASLGRILGINRGGRAWLLVGELPALTPQRPADQDILAFALSERLDAQALAKQVEVADQQYVRQCYSVFPRVTVGPSFEQKETRGIANRNVVSDTIRTSVQKGKLTAPTIQSRDQRNYSRDQIIDTLAGGFLQITLPIWDQNQAQIAKAKFLSDQRRREYIALLNNVALDVEQALTALQVAGELLVLYEKDILPQADTNVTVAQQAYEQGGQSITALIDAKRYLLTQRQAYIAVRRDAALARVALDRAVGGRLPDAAKMESVTTRPMEPL